MMTPGCIYCGKPAVRFLRDPDVGYCYCKCEDCQDEEEKDGEIEISQGEYGRYLVMVHLGKSSIDELIERLGLEGLKVYFAEALDEHVTRGVMKS